MKSEFWKAPAGCANMLFAAAVLQTLFNDCASALAATFSAVFTTQI
jgi:hypothetical protein